MPLKIACISASNAHQNSNSTHACELIADILRSEVLPDADIEIICLADYEFKPCRMCGDCYVNGECADDPAFDRIFAQLRAADAVFVVCPHYATIPAKLVMLLEKLEEIAYLNHCANPEYSFPLKGKPVGLVAHGGQGEEGVPYYQRALLEPLAAAFRSVRARVIGLDAAHPNGAAFGVHTVSVKSDSVFVALEHDWEAVRARLTPLVRNVAGAAPKPVSSTW